MLAKEKALEVATQAPAEADASVVLRQPTYIICDAPCQAPDSDIVPVSDIERVLNEAAQQRLVDARLALSDARSRIEDERATRLLGLESIRAELESHQQQLATLDVQRAQYEQQARVFLTHDERDRMLAQIHLTFNARQLELETTIADRQQTIDALEGEHHATSVAEELELQLLQGDIESLDQVAPEVAHQVQLTMDAPQHLDSAIRLARDGEIQDAEHEVDLARAGGIAESDLTVAVNAIADAKRRSAVRELIAEIQNLQPGIPGTVQHLKRLEQTANQLGVSFNIEPFLNHALKLARSAATARYHEASLQADQLASHGLIPCIGDGRIEAWQVQGNKWVLIDVWMFQEGVWIGHRPRARVTRSEIPRRVRRSPWYKNQRLAPNAA